MKFGRAKPLRKTVNLIVDGMCFTQNGRKGEEKASKQHVFSVWQKHSQNAKQINKKIQKDRGSVFYVLLLLLKLQSTKGDMHTIIPTAIIFCAFCQNPKTQNKTKIEISRISQFWQQWQSRPYIMKHWVSTLIILTWGQAWLQCICKQRILKTTKLRKLWVFSASPVKLPTLLTNKV